MTLWKDRETWGVGLTDKSTDFYSVHHAGSIPARPAILTREQKAKDVTVIGAVECGTKPGSTKPTWKLSSK